MEYTKAQCKEDMITLWGELARSGIDSKLVAAYIISDEFGDFIRSIQFNCPCCYFVGHEVFDENCHKCPINWGQLTFKGLATCTLHSFKDWEFSDTKLKRQYHANRILILSHMIKV